MVAVIVTENSEVCFEPEGSVTWRWPFSQGAGLVRAW